MKNLTTNTVKTMTRLSVFLWLSMIMHAAQADIAIIAHPSNTSDNLQTKHVKAIYLGKSKKLPGGQSVLPVDQKEDSEIHRIFSKNVLGKNEQQLKVYWSKLIFTGTAVPPTVVNGDDEVKKFVAGNPNSIGYISTDALDNSVKLLLKVP